MAVLVSGNGSNLQAILDAAQSPSYAASVAVVISDRPGVAALDRAAHAGVPAEVVDWAGQPDRQAFTKAVCEVAGAYGAELLVLAGFMRILSAEAIARFPNRILNVHPALLPAFPGADAIEAALEHGVKLTGVTVHVVDEEVDHGPIIHQEPVVVAPEDTVATMRDKIQRIEHRLYPRVVDAFARGLIEVEGRVVTWDEGDRR